MPWESLASGSAFGIDWSSAKLPSQVDPYLVWADLTGLSGLVRAGTTEQGIGAVQLVAAWKESLGYLAPPCLREVARSGSTCFLTGDVPKAEIAALLANEGLDTLEFGLALASPRPQKSAGEIPDAERLSGSVMAVIDFGCAFAHRNFRAQGADDAWHTRIRYLWDQARESTPALPWRGVAGQGYGRELTSEAIDRLLAKHDAQGQIDEEACYRAADYGDVRQPLMHGTHVMDLAAGDTPGRLPAADHIVFVQLPRAAVVDTSGSSMAVLVADALRYVLDRLRPDARLVVNLSYGSMAGPHDGSTLIERIMDAIILEQRAQGRGIDIVLPAGNNRDLGAHAAIALGRGKAGKHAGQLTCQLRYDNPADSFVECWYPQDPARDLEFTVEPPGLPPLCLRVGEAGQLRVVPGEPPVAAALHVRSAASGTGLSLFMLALAPTASVSGRARAPYGPWKITAALTDQDAAGPVEVLAWIERDDPWVGDGAPPRQSRLLPGPGAANVAVRQDRTGNSLANGAETWVVAGCYDGSLGAVAAPYSSQGPTCNSARHRLWPDLGAVSEQDRSNPGVLAAGTRSGAPRRMNGTSVAAPQVARWCLNELVKNPKLRGAGSAPVFPESSRDVEPNGSCRVGSGRLNLGSGYR